MQQRSPSPVFVITACAARKSSHSCCAGG